MTNGMDPTLRIPLCDPLGCNGFDRVHASAADRAGQVPTPSPTARVPYQSGPRLSDSSLW